MFIFLCRVKATELVSGKKVCEKVFQHAVAKITIPSRTREQQQRVVGELRRQTFFRGGLVLFKNIGVHVNPDGTVLTLLVHCLGGKAIFRGEGGQVLPLRPPPLEKNIRL